MPDKLLCCLGEAIEHGGSDSHVVIPEIRSRSSQSTGAHAVRDERKQD